MRMTGDIYVYREDRFRVSVTAGPHALTNIVSGDMRLVFATGDLPALESLITAATEARDALLEQGEEKKL